MIAYEVVCEAGAMNGAPTKPGKRSIGTHCFIRRSCDSVYEES
jgi:hypothetical protein